MISNKFSAVILAMLSVSTVLADAERKGEPFEYERHPYDIHQFYDNIPDLINATEVNFWFY
jgi:hypothetical protein